MFKEVAGDEGRIPVAITCKIDNKNYIFTVEGDSVILKESKLPQRILSKTSEFIFYRRRHDNGFISLESSLERGSYLACSDDDSNLKLKRCSEDEIDETAKFDFKILVLHSFVKQPDPPNIPYHFRNIHSDLLIANPRDSIATFKSDGHPEGEQAVFYLNTYRSNDMSSNALPVAISCHVGRKNYILCVQSNSVILKEGKLPEIIASRTSEYIFYVTEFSDPQPDNHLLKFESSSEQKCFLAWQTTDLERKLILKKEVNDIDETKRFALKEKN
ncbi:interleukin-18-like [Leptodactylus fuscus]|uniref:interleukin-18-like n=1 Tax=Leptodactylus fuscus TaxID=238119 RepID=UPI003F4E575B